MINSRFRAFTLLVILAVTASSSCILTSCTSKGEEQTNATGNGEITADQPSSAEQSIYDVLPQKDFGGEEFVIYNPPNPDSPVDKGTSAEDQNGEIFNDAVYLRNKTIEDKFNVKIRTHSGANWDSTYQDLRKMTSAGLTEYDVVFTHVISNTASYITEGLIQDWQKVPYVDFTKPWWNQSCINSMKINGRSFFASGSMHIHDPLVLIVNKDLIKAYNMEFPYDLVKSGGWTIDKLAEMAKMVVKDLNGNGQMDTEDQYGLEYGSVWQIPSLFYGCGMQSVLLDTDGKPTVNLNTSHMVEIYEKLYDLLYTEDKTILYSGTKPEEANHPHIGVESGRILFTQMNLFTCENLRQTEVDYGIVPFPKYDSSQEDYRSVSWTGMLTIPSYIVDETRLEKIGLVMEAMAAEGYSKVIPVYYDVILKEKYARDEDSRLMLDMIMKSIVYDIGLCFNDAGGAGMYAGGQLSAKKQSYVSGIEKAEQSMQKKLDEVFTKISEIYT